MPVGEPRFSHHHYVIALTVATALFYAVVGLFKHKSGIQRLIRVGGDIAGAIVPRALSLVAFASGALLLFSGAMPAVGHRLQWVYGVLPLPVVELSHFADNLLGASLLILARGLERRLDAAYHLTLVALAAAIVFSLARALDYEQALTLALMLVLFLPAKRFFNRKTPLIEERYSPSWILVILLVVLASIALGVMSYQKVQLRADVIYSATSQEARFFRSTAGLLGALIVFAVYRMVRPIRLTAPRPNKQDLLDVSRIVAAHTDASAHLALLGDKHFLWNGSRSGFVMYGISGRSLVSLGDPVGPAAEIPSLIESFVLRAREQSLHPVFYKTSPVLLYLYLDFGLAVVKLGEEAKVSLPDFSMDGSHRKNLRRVWRKMVDAGCSFEMLSPGQVTAHLPELRTISSSWLTTRRAKEKGFSLGFFSDDYIVRHHVGIARKDGQIVAFANLWCSGAKEELEVDLMRYPHDSPPGIMRYLVTEMMIWGRDNGFRTFNLGMAPLSGMRQSAAAPVWHQLATAVRGYGERFYNFKGIREFKEWFHPEWEPRFLVSPGGTVRPLVLANLASLISAGPKNTFAD